MIFVRDKAVGGLGPVQPIFLPLQRAYSNTTNETQIEDRHMSPISVIEPLVNADYEKSKLRFLMRSPLHPGKTNQIVLI